MLWGVARGQNLVHIQEVVFLHSRHTVLKISGSPYLGNHLSESIHTWTIGTLLGKLSFHDMVPQSPCPGVGQRSKSSTSSKCGISALKVF